MTATAVVGLQWGDEAKGKIVDLICQTANVVARFNGGDNAGHTVVNQYGTFKLRLSPNGFYNPDTICVIGPGVVVNLSTLLDEIDRIQASGIQLTGRYWISPRCHVVMPYHPMMESIFEITKGVARTGTTRRGMGPVYADKVSYNGIRLFDLANKQLFAEKLHIQLALKNPIFEAFGLQPLDFDQVYDEKLAQYEHIREWVGEPFGLIQEILANQGHVVLEGAQGALLDNNWGSYPFCTASITLAGGAAAGLGIGPHWIQRVLGVAKAYTTRVGAGPMPTELQDEVGNTLQQEGNEFGTVTGRPRRCGWFDADLVHFTCQLSGVTELALTKLDVLDTLPLIKICTGYQHPSTGERLRHYWEGDADWLGDCLPLYIEMEGWQQPTKQARSFSELPAQARNYIQKIEELVGVPIRFISIGPEREATIRVPG